MSDRISEKRGYVYILANKRNNVLYVGVSNDLIRRIQEHRRKVTPGFTSKYRVTKLVYFETHESIIKAIEREKQLKNLVRRKKIKLIEYDNPLWKDLYNDLVEY